MDITKDKNNTSEVTLHDIKSGYKNELSKQDFISTQLILLKMQRDLVSISSTIVADKNLEKDQNYMIIKEQIKTLSEHMNKEIEYIKLACQYEDTPEAQKVREKLLACEYSETKYNQTLDYEFWEDREIYMREGSVAQIKKLSEIHNSDLSVKTAVLFVSSLDYKIIRDNNWGRGYLYRRYERLTKLYSNQALGFAREQFRKSRNDSISKLFSIFDFTTDLHSILASGYYPKTYDILTKNSYMYEWSDQRFINRKAKEFHKSLKTGPNASCWNKAK